MSFEGKICPRICVALKVRLIYAISATSGRENVLFFKSVIGHFVDDDGF